MSASIAARSCSFAAMSVSFASTCTADDDVPIRPAIDAAAVPAGPLTAAPLIFFAAECCAAPLEDRDRGGDLNPPLFIAVEIPRVPKATTGDDPRSLPPARPGDLLPLPLPLLLRLRVRAGGLAAITNGVTRRPGESAAEAAAAPPSSCPLIPSVQSDELTEADDLSRGGSVAVLPLGFSGLI
jgi:hypothetical protein